MSPRNKQVFEEIEGPCQNYLDAKRRTCFVEGSGLKFQDDMSLRFICHQMNKI
jgi:hypothetical protein